MGMPGAVNLAKIPLFYQEAVGIRIDAEDGDIVLVLHQIIFGFDLTGQFAVRPRQCLEGRCLVNRDLSGIESGFSL